jgi:hypothetical protein
MSPSLLTFLLGYLATLSDYIASRSGYRLSRHPTSTHRSLDTHSVVGEATKKNEFNRTAGEEILIIFVHLIFLVLFFSFPFLSSFYLLLCPFIWPDGVH